jgi:hypothetical protein
MRNKIEYMIEKRPDKVAEMIEKVYKHNPDIIEEMLEYPEGAEHIPSRKKYEELINKVKWSDGSGRGAKWSFEDIKRNTKINFDNVDYTEYDYAYLVNMLYAKCCKHITDASIFLKLAKCLLEDSDEETKMYRGAEYHKHKNSKHGIQSRYDDYDIDDYDEEARRRRRRYRNESENYRNEDYRRYDSYNSVDSRYRDNNIGFNTLS